MITGIHERVREEVDVPDWREGNDVRHPKTIHCSPARKCNFHLGWLGYSAFYLSFACLFLVYFAVCIIFHMLKMCVPLKKSWNEKFILVQNIYKM